MTSNRCGCKRSASAFRSGGSRIHPRFGVTANRVRRIADMMAVMARLTSPPRLVLRWDTRIDDHVIALDWSNDGSILAAASVGGPVTLFDVNSGNVRHTLPGHGFGTTAVAWRPDSKILATAGQDGKVRLWDSGT